MYLAKVIENLINIDLDKILYIPPPKTNPKTDTQEITELQ